LALDVAADQRAVREAILRMNHDTGAVAIAVIAGCIVAWGFVSARLTRWNISAPMAFVVLGLVTTHGPLALFHPSLHSTTILTVVELTLAIVLFGDASRINVRTLRGGIAPPLRLLGIGLPLAIGAGTALAFALFGGSAWVAAAIGAIVAPTDAALGAPIMGDKRVPIGVRRTLNIESGLNDGIATPFVNLFLAGAVASEALSTTGVAHAALALLGGTGIGIGVGAIGAVLLAWSKRSGWGAPGFRPLCVFALAVLAYSLAIEAGTNGFVAAFVGGMAFGTVLPALPDSSGRSTDLTFTEDAGELLSLLVWFTFGAVMMVPGLREATFGDVVFAVLALTVVRMVPVGVALLGSGLNRSTVAFIGWFGPRGLASVVFALIAVDSLDAAASHVVLGAVSVTVLLSVVAHGWSAGPLAARYARIVSRMDADAPELIPRDPVPTRSARVTHRMP
jgi:NhaP-type Na+/H+ or K+/H+ antiporter